MSHTKWRSVGHLFTYVKTCERGLVFYFEQRSHVYNAICYNAGFFRGPRRPRYNGVTVYKENVRNYSPSEKCATNDLGRLCSSTCLFMPPIVPNWFLKSIVCYNLALTPSNIRISINYQCCYSVCTSER